MPQWVRTSVTVIAWFLAVVGVAGLKDNIETWEGWLTWLNKGVPWWLFLVASAVLVALLYVPLLLAAWKARSRLLDSESPHEAHTREDHVEPGDVVPPLYEDQQAMLEAGWGIETVVQDADVDRVWFALGTGYHFNDLPNEQIKRCIQRMVLSKPNADLLNGIYRDNPDRLEYAVSNIYRAYEKAKGNGVDVRVSDTLSLQGLLVFKKDSVEDWARIQTPLPPSDADQWPSSVIRRKDHEALFLRVEGAFNALHDAGEPLTIKAEGTQQLGSREAIQRLQEVVGEGRAIRLLADFVEQALLPAIAAKDAAGAYLEMFIVPQHVKPLRDAAEEWRMASRDHDVSPEDAQRAFLAMYKAWHGLRGVVDKCRQILGVEELGHINGFKDWYVESWQFTEELAGILSRDDLYFLKQGIENYHDDHAPVTFRLTP